MAKKNLAVCIPSGRFVDFSFFQSFSNSIAQIMLEWNAAVFTVSSPYIQANRNEILRRVLKFEQANPGFEFDYLLWLDTDMVFTFEHVKKLMARLGGGMDFVSGTYFNPKDGGILPVAYRKDGGKYSWLSEKDIAGKGMLEVDAVGFGFCVMRAGIARDLMGKFNSRPFDLRYLPDGGMVGEDQIFCERAKELGWKIWLDTSIVVKHAKGCLPR